ncbi:MAG: magnesium chelatase domain-containing protein, partial [Patescibacteria group bacterium]|nr:magnesium chelatase domain-containing protein [Patescibacteria group bacterium]
TQPEESFGSIYYVCGEESPSQISLRTERIINNEQFLSTYSFGKSSKKLSKLLDQHLKFITTTNVDQLVQLIKQEKPSLVIVDSIQTLTTQDLTGTSGSVGQVREATDRLVKVGKQLSVAMFLVGHVTKKGTIAGPKTLEHIVDSVLELSGERTGQFRMIRALKNRFGATDEVGVFKLAEYGLEEVLNPSELFIESEHGKTPGSAITCVMEGTRPILIEVQALVNKSHLPMPRRVGRGIDLSRIQVLSAVLQKHCHLPISDHDVFLSAAGGFKVKEPSVDLGLAVAIAGSLKEKVLPKKTIFIGEIGLLGEIRPVAYLDRRIKEAKRLGFEQIISSKKYQQVRAVIGKFLK